MCSWCVSVCRAVLDVSKLGARLPQQHSFRTGWCQQWAVTLPWSDPHTAMSSDLTMVWSPYSSEQWPYHIPVHAQPSCLFQVHFNAPVFSKWPLSVGFLHRTLYMFNFSPTTRNHYVTHFCYSLIAVIYQDGLTVSSCILQVVKINNVKVVVTSTDLTL